jgi:hypothetical protein
MVHTGKSSAKSETKFCLIRTVSKLASNNPGFHQRRHFHRDSHLVKMSMVNISTLSWDQSPHVKPMEAEGILFEKKVDSF